MDTIKCKGHKDIKPVEEDRILTTASYINNRRDAFHLTGMEGLTLDKFGGNEPMTDKDMGRLRSLHYQYGHLAP